MSALTEIEAVAETLPPEELRLLLSRLGIQLEKKTVAERASQPRIAGMHRGAWQVAPDFDALLPDEFWLGKEL